MVYKNNQWRFKLHNVCFIFISFIISGQKLFAQQVFDNAPADMRWHQINTPHFRVIFPENYTKNAQYVAHKLEQIYLPVSGSLDAPPQKISVLLQNRNSVSNGFVTLSPRRSEFYTMPPQDYNFLGTNNWLDLITVHEYRHIVQFEQSKTGITRFFSYIFGQNAQAGLANIAAPQWFWEGDATLMETLYSPSGRGRIPDFNRIYRSNLLSGKDFKYIKQHLGSYKDYVPNHYVLGFHYTTFLRKETGDSEIWEKITEDAFAWPFIPFTFSNALKRNTGMNIRENYRAMQKDLRLFWEDQQFDLSPESYTTMAPKNKIFTNYFYPQLLADGTIVAQKDGLGDVLQFVVLDKSGEEIDSYIPGIVNESGMLSTAGNKVVWNEIFVDVRRGKKSASVIKTYDFATKEKKTITRGTRYTGAALSPDGERIVTSLTTETQEHFLVVIEDSTGSELKRFSTTDNSYLSMARFSSDGNKIVALRHNQNGKSVVAFDYASGEMEELIAPGFDENIGHPVLTEDYLFYNSPYNGIDNIYVLNLTTSQRYQVTNSQYGAYNPFIDGANGIIYFNDHKEKGMNISSFPLNPDHWKPLSEVSVTENNYAASLLEQENMEALEEMDTTISFPVKRYRSLAHIFNLHSWGPLASTDLNTAQVGIYSDDILKTTSITAGYEYNINDRSGNVFAEVSYQGLFPIFDFRIEKGDRSSTRIFNEETIGLTWEEMTTQTGVRIPLNLTRSKFFSRMELGYNVGIRKITEFNNDLFDEGNQNRINTDRIAPWYDVEVNINGRDTLIDIAYLYTNEITNGTLAFDNLNFSYYLLQKQSSRDLNSRWGAVLDMERYKTRDVFNSDFNGSLLALRSTFYLPSPLYLINKNLTKHHSIYIRYNWQQRENEFSSGLYYFQNRIFMPRGYSYPAFEEFTTLSFNYKLPLFYPDFNLGPFLYVKRAKLNMFYDWGSGNGRQYYLLYDGDDNLQSYLSSSYDRQYQSIGAELTFDINVMRFPADVDLGVRGTYLLNDKTATFDFLLLNIDF